jgi:hypothetical protein
LPLKLSRHRFPHHSIEGNNSSLLPVQTVINEHAEHPRSGSIAQHPSVDPNHLYTHQDPSTGIASYYPGKIVINQDHHEAN